MKNYSMNHPTMRFSFLLVMLLSLLNLPTLAQSLPTGFNNSLVQNGYTTPMGTVFSADGKQLFVWDKAGRVWVSTWNGTQYSKQAAPVLDISEEVGNWRDFGLASLCLDPNFATNGLIYLFYMVDRHHLLYFGTASYSATKDEYYNASISRVTRYKVTTTNNVLSTDLNSRKVLLGETKSTGVPLTHESHAGGTLLFGTDGTLLVSTGDNASYSSTDKGSASETYWQTAINDGILRTNENVGAFRAQMVNSHCGKILRLDPATGNGVASNPFYDSTNPRSPASRVWAMGFRNPYRMGIQPGTGSTNPANANPGTLLVGDVGWDTWEDMHLIRQGGENAGWPIFEGILENSSYNAVAQTLENKDEPNPNNTCNKPYFTFANLLRQASSTTTTVTNPCNNSQPLPGLQRRYVHSVPALDWNHSASTARAPQLTATTTTAVLIGAAGSPVTGTPFNGNCSTGGAYYSGTNFPAAYRNLYYFGDYGANWIKAATLGSNGTITDVKEFVPAGGTNGVVDIEFNPLDGAIYYTNINNGEIRKISYGTNQPPIAVLSADKTKGPSPLTVQFKGDGSSDPDGDALTYAWDFGDGTKATTANPSHIFSGTNTQGFTVQLTVTDTKGLTASQQIVISLNNAAPTVKITNPVNGGLYPLDRESIYQLKADVTDESVSSLSYSWQVTLRHNNHQHVEPAISAVSPSVNISPVGCDGNTYYYLITVRVTDNGGLTAMDSVKIYPDCASLNLAVQNLKAVLSGATNTNLTWNYPTAPFDEVLVAVRAGSSFLDRPTGTNYTANADFQGNGSAIEGGKVVYRGVATAMTVSNLSPQTTYYFRVYTRAGNAWSGGVEVSLTMGTVSTPGQFDPALCYKITNRVSNKVLGVEGALMTDDASVKQRTFVDQPWQKWKFQSLGSNSYQLTATHSGKVLAVQGASTQGWANVIQSTNTNATNQKWVIQTGSDGYSTLKAVHSNLLLDISSQDEGSQVIQYAASGSYVQYWKIETTGCTSTTSTPPVSATVCYKITNRVSGKVLGVEGALTSDGALVKQQTFGNQLWQKWALQPTGATNTYQLAAIHSGKVLAVQGASTQGWANVVQSTNTNATNQKWVIQTGSDGYSTLKAVHSNLLLDIANQNEGGQVIQYAASGSYVQYWKIETVGCTTSGGRLSAEYEQELKVFPNPAREYVNVDLPDTKNAIVQLDLLTSVGQLIRSEVLTLEGPVTHRLSVIDLPTGLYLIRARAEGQWNLTQRLLIIR
ncbi:PKD domain-containing protein [Spirosoma sp. HMF4905]|uniref:PKD domain-containing protein n=1 Tax=Spirosoma arboris TaxID=2682092 RepID=A0A7K1SFL3_9BACT|nr:RICIN domain-containing protein [Spirosoma arboris]MVM32592.1 PKD domain-containing protein [Spirosoma arboris]